MYPHMPIYMHVALTLEFVISIYVAIKATAAECLVRCYKPVTYYTIAQIT